MACRVFGDANILLDFTLRREHYKVARQIIELGVNGDIHLFTTPAIIQIIAYWLTKAYGKVKAKELILAMLADITVIDADHEVTVNAVHAKMDDMEDTLQYYTAIHHKLDYFLTRDRQMKKTALPVLPVCTPEDVTREVYH